MLGKSIASSDAGQNTAQVKPTLSDWIEKVIRSPEAVAAIRGTEEKIVRAYQELLSGYENDPSQILNVIREVDGDAGLVIQQDINFYSMCYHHFLPFFGKVDLVYEPGKLITGLGKLRRLVDVYAKRFQIQEELGKQIAEELMSSGKAKGSFVRCTATHLCVCARGANDDTTRTVTTYACGSLAEPEQQRQIFTLLPT